MRVQFEKPFEDFIICDPSSVHSEPVIFNSSWKCTMYSSTATIPAPYSSCFRSVASTVSSSTWALSFAFSLLAASKAVKAIFWRLSEFLTRFVKAFTLDLQRLTSDVKSLFTEVSYSTTDSNSTCFNFEALRASRNNGGLSFQLLGLCSCLGNPPLELLIYLLQPLHVHLGIYEETLRLSLHSEARLYHIYRTTGLGIEGILVCAIFVIYPCSWFDLSREHLHHLESNLIGSTPKKFWAFPSKAELRLTCLLLGFFKRPSSSSTTSSCSIIFIIEIGSALIDFLSDSSIVVCRLEGDGGPSIFFVKTDLLLFLPLEGSFSFPFASPFFSGGGGGFNFEVDPTRPTGSCTLLNRSSKVSSSFPQWAVS